MLTYLTHDQRISFHYRVSYFENIKHFKKIFFSSFSHYEDKQGWCCKNLTIYSFPTPPVPPPSFSLWRLTQSIRHSHQVQILKKQLGEELFQLKIIWWFGWEVEWDKRRERKNMENDLNMMTEWYTSRGFNEWNLKRMSNQQFPILAAH